MENDVLQLLMKSPGHRYSLKEISKFVDRKQYREDSTWARSLLQGMVNRCQVHKDTDGRFFVPGPEEKP